MTGLEAVLPLAGVALGAAGSYWTSSAGDRQRWHRQQQSRWDLHRKDAYVEYGYAVKSVSEVSKRMAAAREFSVWGLRGLWIKAGLREEAGQEVGPVLHVP